MVINSYFATVLLVESDDLSSFYLLDTNPNLWVVSDEEWKVLSLTFHKGKPLAIETPTLTWLLHTIAKVGGWCNSKRTGVPGWQVIWEGWAKLQDRLHTYRMTKGVEMWLRDRSTRGIPVNLKVTAACQILNS